MTKHRVTREHCFYCNRVLSPPKGGRAMPTSLTMDHVYPVTVATYPAGLYVGHSPVVNQPTPRNHPLNRVVCCFECNQLKGDLHPLEWLTIVLNETCATRLSELLLKVGEDPEQVNTALAARTIRIGAINGIAPGSQDPK